ncbi:putative lipoprotein [Bdellovibrio bacteriovorus W]|nr:putative lipoprotein [Bdellovibrio bacteriovorus W]
MLRNSVMALLGASFLLISCQTSPLKSFSEIKPGMEKGDVLYLMGSPNRTERVKGKDRWTYIFYENRIRFEKEVVFARGNAVYMGNPVEAEGEKTALAMDMRNDRINQEALEAEEQSRKKHRLDYENYESQTRGEDKVRYVPQFEAIQ